MAERGLEKSVGGGAQAELAPGSPVGRSTLTGGDHLEGNGLPYQQRSLFESSTGKDLSGVRVHTDGAAASKADGHGARAYALGNDIHFAAGEYKPGTRDGDALLAHEVAHTVQQREGLARGSSGDIKTTTPGDHAETNADTAAGAMLEGKPAEVSSEPVAIARKAKSEAVAPPPAVESASEAAPAGGEVASGDKDAKAGDEQAGEFSVERAGVEEDEGSEPIGPPQNLEAGKAELAAKGAALPPDGGAESLKGAAKGAAGGGGGPAGAEDVPVSDELQMSVMAAQADAKAGADEAQAEAEAYKAEMKGRRDQLDEQQLAGTLEQIKTMTPADKRSSLVEMGYDQKSVKKMKDAELDGMISGRIETEQRKTKILGMDEKELAGLTAAQKSQFLVDLGVDKKDLDKIGAQKAAQAFDDVIRVSRVPGEHKVKVKIKGGLLAKSWEIKVNVDAQGNADFDAQKKGGFLSKLWGWVKLALPIIAIVLAPLTAGGSLIALAVYQTVTSIANGDWMGAIIGVAGAFVGVGALKMVKDGAGAAAKAFKSIADVAGKVKSVASAAKAAAAAAKAKSPGGLMAALAQGASSFADFAESAASKFAVTMNRWADRLEKWSGVVNGGEAVIAGIKAGDPGAAIAGAFSGAAAAVSKKTPDGTETSAQAKNFARYSRIAGFASAGERAAKGNPPNYGSIVESAMGVAAELSASEKVQDAARITRAANRLTNAVVSKNPGELAAAAIGLAEAIQVAQIQELDDKGEKLAGADDERAKVQKRYQTAASVVQSATAAINAVAKKPRPDYAGALAAATALIADLTENKNLDRAALVSSKFDAMTKAVLSKDEKAILAAAESFGTALVSIKDELNAEKAAAKLAAEAKLAPGETLPDPGGLIPSTSFTALTELPGAVVPSFPDIGEDEDVEGEVEGDGEAGRKAPANPAGRRNTKNANYTVVSGDTLSNIAAQYDTNLSTLRSANPQLAGDAIFVGQRIVVPGADTKPKELVGSVETFITDPHLAPGTAKPEPKYTIPADVMLALDVADQFASIGEWPEPLQKLIGDVQSAAKAINGLSKESKTAGAEYAKYYAVLSAASKTTIWLDAFVKKVAGYKADIGDLLDDDGVAQPIRVLTQYARLGQTVAKVAKLPLDTFKAVDAYITMCGFKPDGSPASLVERADAAWDLATGSYAIYKDLAFIGSLAKSVAPKLVEKAAAYGAKGAAKIATKLAASPEAMQAAEAALSSMRATASNVFSKIGGPKAVDIVMKRATPIIEQIAKTKGGEVAAKTAQALARELGLWGGELANLGVNTELQAVLGRLAPRLMVAGEIAASAPVWFAIEYIKFEVTFTAELYQQASASFSQWLSIKAFGKMHHILKEEINRQPIASPAQCDAFFAYADKLVAGGYYADVKQNWANTWRSQLPQRCTDIRFEAGRTLTNGLQYYGIGVKIAAATALKGIALEFLDSEFRRIFKFNP